MDRQIDKQLIHHLQDLEIFRGFDADELQETIYICHAKSYQANESVFKESEDSQDIFILLQGHLVVVSKKGETLDSVMPGECVGEVEAFSRESRIANVVASLPSSGVMIRSADIDRMMAGQPSLYIKLVRNIYRILCDRLDQTNRLIDSHHSTPADDDSSEAPEA